MKDSELFCDFLSYSNRGAVFDSYRFINEYKVYRVTCVTLHESKGGLGLKSGPQSLERPWTSRDSHYISHSCGLRPHLNRVPKSSVSHKAQLAHLTTTIPLSWLRKSKLSQEIVLSWAESGFLLAAWLCFSLSLPGHGGAFKRIRRSSAQTSGVLNSLAQKIGTSDAFGAFSNLARWKIFLSLTSLAVTCWVDR